MKHTGMGRENLRTKSQAAMLLRFLPVPCPGAEGGEKACRLESENHDPRKGAQGRRSTVAGCSERQMAMVLELPGASCPMLPH